MNILNFQPRESPRGLVCNGKSKCQKHLAKMCDVKNMIARAISGDSTVYRRGSYGDFTVAPDDMQAYLNSLCRGREAYENLSPEIKAAYPTPEAFLNALGNKDEKERLIKLGVFERKPESKPVEVRVIGDNANKGTNPAAHAETT